MSGLIEAQGLTRRYGAVTVVDGVSFTVARGELLALVGASGSGKTTTLKMINRLVEADAGRVLLEGRDTAQIELLALRRSMGYVFQGIGLFPHMTIAENVALPLQLLAWERERKEARVKELLELVELAPDTGERFPAALSGGQQQRAGVARALAASPSVLLMDEPFGALDPLTRDRLQQTLARLRRELALTAVLVTHDMAEALVLADRIGVMRAGRLLQVGSPEELARSPADDEVARMLDTPRRQARLVAARLGTAE